MRTPKQIAASRENGRKSNGAVTPEGKARIVNANLDTGIFAETHVLSWEFQEDLEDMREEYYAAHPPSSPEARCLLDHIILCEWQLRRLGYAESSLWQELGASAPANSSDAAHALFLGDQKFQRVQYRLNSTLRSFQNALRELERVQARDAAQAAGPEDSNALVTDTPEKPLQVLGSLRQNDPAAGEAA